jgi:O-antigen ligase
MLRDLEVRRIVLIGVTGIVGFWCVDGVIQLLFGRDLFGYPYDGSVLKGVFYPKQRFGLVISVFAPLLCYAAWRFSKQTPWAWLTLLPLVIGVTFSLKRTAWIMLLAALVMFAVCFMRTTRTNVTRVVTLIVVSALFVGVTVFSVPKLHTQVTDTLDIFSTDFKTADVATSHRLSLWKTGLSVARAHWVNGVGPRGFRTVYREFASSDDFWIARGNSGQTHPHLMTLEVFVETGVIGLLGYALCLSMLLHGFHSMHI